MASGLDLDEWYSCGICNDRLPTRREHKDHMRRHAKAYPLQCTMCDLRVKTEDELSQHTTAHDERRMKKCKDCNLIFYTKQQLAVHARSHKGVKPYRCPLCAQAYSTRYNLCRHRENGTCIGYMMVLPPKVVVDPIILDRIHRTMELPCETCNEDGNESLRAVYGDLCLPFSTLLK